MKNISLNNWWQRALFWITVWLFYAYFFSYQSTNIDYVIWFSTILLPITMFTTYFFVKKVTPKLLSKNYLDFVLHSFFALVFSAYGVLMTIYLCLKWLSNYSIEEFPLVSRNVFFMLILMYLVVGLAGFYDLLKHNFKQIADNKDLQNKMLATELRLKDQELKYLKKQIHPHFLFNTLNTIYGFSLKKSDKTPEMILKLSRLLDYILYQVQKPNVFLKDELKHMKDYIALERIRFSETLKVDFQIVDFKDEIQIPPMLLIPFVENAFKHGNAIDGFLMVIMEIMVVENDLYFKVENTVGGERRNSKPGIGLTNIRKRLELLYPNQYDLKIENEENWFRVFLHIEGIQ
ncbi:MAG: two-component system LytT family sensor kinase [Cognaticolwellia sp.]|jgi:sensor histidine kinase YesM